MKLPGHGVISAGAFAPEGVELGEVPRLTAVWGVRSGGHGGEREARLLFIGGRCPVVAAPGFRLGLHGAEDRAVRLFVAWLADRSRPVPEGWEICGERWSVCVDCGRIHADPDKRAAAEAGGAVH